MPGKFEWKSFNEVDLSDEFFDSLKEDYIEFSDWFQKKSEANENTLVFSDEQGTGAFLYLKRENEEIELDNKVLPSLSRLKIGTLRLAERFRGMRLGEGALGVALWYWREIKADEIYVTVFERHSEIINLFERFGLKNVGKNKRGELVYVKNRNHLDYSDPYKSFPFISPNIKKAGIIPIFDNYHDRLFPYSELKGKKNEIEEETAGNGITKVFIGSPASSFRYNAGEPVLIYRIHTGQGQKTFKSTVTSYCTITKIDLIKDNGVDKVPLNDFIKNAGNKTVFTEEELITIFKNNKNVVMLELIYNGYFGKGHNVNHLTLKNAGLFSTYPYDIEYSLTQFKTILEMGDTNVQNVIIN